MVRADDDMEESFALKKSVSPSSVLPFVGVACLGALLFGYHLGYMLFPSFTFSSAFLFL
jgi:hypothetical protein